MTATAEHADKNSPQVEDVAPIAKPQKKTKGDKFFGALNWVLNYIVTFVASVGLAYYIRDSSRPSWFGKTNADGTKENWRTYTQRKKEELGDTILKIPFLKGIEKNEVFNHKAVASIFVSTVATFPGGFLTLPVMRWMEKNKQSIVHWYNKKYGTQEDVEAGDRNTENHPIPSWGSLLKGRLASFAIVFTSFMGLLAVAPTFVDKTEDNSAKLFAKTGQKLFSKRDLGDYQEILDNPALPHSNWAYRLHRTGHISAFDFIATAASVTLTLMISALLGKKKETPPQAVNTQSVNASPSASAQQDNTPVPEAAPQQASEKKYGEEVQPKAKPVARGENHLDAHAKDKAAAPAEAALV